MTTQRNATRPERPRTWGMTNGGPRTGRFRVPGEGAMLVALARRGVVTGFPSGEIGAVAHRIRRIDDYSPLPRVKSPGYRPTTRMTPKRGMQ
jgi:hypothetical protein